MSAESSQSTVASLAFESTLQGKVVDGKFLIAVGDGLEPQLGFHLNHSGAAVVSAPQDPIGTLFAIEDEPEGGIGTRIGGCPEVRVIQSVEELKGERKRSVFPSGYLRDLHHRQVCIEIGGSAKSVPSLRE